MTVTHEELVKIRMYLLKQMDAYIKAVGDEVITERWQSSGLEDGWDEDILRDYAEDETLWLGCVYCFKARVIDEIQG